MTGYTRQSAADIIPGEDITAAPLNAEFNALEAAFHASTGHTHDGTAGNGVPINFSALIGTVPIANGGTGNTSAAAALSALGGQPLDDDLTALAALASTGIMARTASNTYVMRTITAGTGMSVSNGDGVSGNPTITINAALTNLTDINVSGPSSNQILRYNSTSSKWENVTVTVGPVNVLDDLTDVNISSPSSGQFIKYNGSAWVNSSVSTPTNLDDLADVTITAAAANEFLMYNGSAWVDTTAANARTALALVVGTNVQAWDATLDAFAAYNTSGLITQTAANTFTGRTVTAGTGISVSNGNGVSGNPTINIADTAVTPGSYTTANITVDQQGRITAAASGSASVGDDLTAIEALSTTGVLCRTGSNLWAHRTITGTANRITVSNGDGVSGNPVINLAAATVIASGQSITFDSGSTLTLPNDHLSGDKIHGGTISNGQIEFVAGSASAPSITFSGDTNTGLYQIIGDQIAMTSGGTQVSSHSTIGHALITTNTTGSVTAQANSSSFTGDVFKASAPNMAAGTGFDLITAEAASSNIVFRVRGDGTVTADVSFTGGGADYAEYFPYEVRPKIGAAVTLNGETVEEAYLFGMPYEDIIGVVVAPGSSGFIGDKRINDDLQDENEVIVGLLGKIKVLKTAPKNPRWIKMKEIDDQFDLYLVR